MTIALKLLCREMFGELPDGDYEVPEGATAAEALAFCAGVPGETAQRVMFMCCGKHIRPETVLADGDRLLVLRPLRGG